jgi:XTP/dITP diphosphohydrolase
VRGRIVEEPRGSGGFGFDPVFAPEGVDKTFAEMSVEEKNKYSNRAAAARKLCDWLTGHHDAL